MSGSYTAPARRPPVKVPPRRVHRLLVRPVRRVK